MGRHGRLRENKLLGSLALFSPLPKRKQTFFWKFENQAILEYILFLYKHRLIFRRLIMTNTILLEAEAPVINHFLPATGALTAGIFISLCKDIAQTVQGFS